MNTRQLKTECINPIFKYDHSVAAVFSPADFMLKTMFKSLTRLLSQPIKAFLTRVLKVNVEGFATDSLQKIPASVSILTADLIAEQHARVLSDVIKNDAAIGEGYAAIGYYPNFVSRGFALDLASQLPH